MSLRVNGVDISEVIDHPEVHRLYRRLSRRLVPFIIACFGLGPVLAFGVFGRGFPWLPVVWGGFFVVSTVLFVSATIQVRRAALRVKHQRRLEDDERLARAMAGLERGLGKPARTRPQWTRRISTCCPACGARVGPDRIEDAPEGPVVVCPYCDCCYPLEESADL